MQTKGYQRAAFCAVVVQLCSTGVTQGSSIPVPSAAQMVLDANAIVEAVVRTKGNLVVAEIDDVIKGVVNARQEVRLIAQHGVMEFDLHQFVESLAGRRSLVLGNWDQDRGELRLPWLGVSVWPQGEPGFSFASQDLDACRDFVARVLTYERLADSDPNELVVQLFADAQTLPGQHAALGFLAAERSSFRNEVPSYRWTLAAMVADMAERAQVDRRSVESIAAFSPKLPASLAGAYFLTVAESSDDQEARSMAQLHLAAILRSRRLVAKDQDDEFPTLQQIYQSDALNPLRVRDAKDALSLFDARTPAIQERAASVLQWILVVPANSNERRDPWPDDQKNSRGYWARRIAALERD